MPVVPRGLISFDVFVNHLSHPDAVSNFRLDSWGGFDFFPIQTDGSYQGSG